MKTPQTRVAGNLPKGVRSFTADVLVMTDEDGEENGLLVGNERIGAGKDDKGRKKETWIQRLCWGSVCEWVLRIFMLLIVCHLLLKIKELEARLDCNLCMTQPLNRNQA